MFKRKKSICEKCIQDAGGCFDGLDQIIESYTSAGQLEWKWSKEFGMMGRPVSSNIFHQFAYCEECSFILEHLVLAKQ